MNLFLEIVLSNSLMAILLALLAAGVSLFKPRPAIMHGLWLLVLVKLVTPPLVSIPIPGWESNLFQGEPATEIVSNQQTGELKAVESKRVNLAKEQPVSALPPESISPTLEDAKLSARVPRVDPVAPGSDRQLNNQVEKLVQNEPSVANQKQISVSSPDPVSAKLTSSSTPVSSADSSINRLIDAVNLRTILLSVWCLGSLAWLLLSLVRIARFQNLLRFAQTAPSQIIEETEQLASQLGLRQPPEVVTLPGRISPLVWPIGKRVRLILPEALLIEINQEERKTLIAHELVHLCRRDHWVRLLELLTLVVYWWHPVVWWARTYLRRAEEQCCDAWVVQTWPEQTRAYADALLQAVGFLADAPKTDRELPLPASGLGNLQVLQRRLTMIFDGDVPARLTISSRVALLILAVSFLPLIPDRTAIADSENAGTFLATNVENQSDESTTTSAEQNTKHEKTDSSNPKTSASDRVTQKKVKKIKLQANQSPGSSRSNVRQTTDKATESDQGTLTVMTGVVQDSQGQPVVGAKLWLADRDSRREDELSRVYSQTKSDKEGRFEFRAKLSGNDYRSFFIHALDEKNRIGWTVGRRLQDLPLDQMNIKLQETKDYQGKLVDLSGQPISGAIIKPLYFRGNSFRAQRHVFYGGSTLLSAEYGKQYEVKTKADGTFLMTKIPMRGSIVGIVSAPGFGSPQITWDLSSPVTIRLQRAGEIRGSLVSQDQNAPLSGVNLELQLQPGTGETGPGSFGVEYSATSQSINDGLFHFKGVPPGKYTITSPLKPTQNYYAETKTPIVIKADETVSGLSVPLHKAIAIRGRVINSENNTGVEGIQVVVSRTARSGRTAWDSTVTTKAGGSYEIYVKPGRLRVGVYNPPLKYLPGPQLSETREITEDVRLPDGQLQLASTISGTVVNEAGGAISEATVYSLSPSRHDHEQSQTNAEGAFTVQRLFPGETVPLLARTEVAVTDGPLDIVPKDVKGAIQLTVSKSKAFRVRGNVVDQSGRPVKNAQVLIKWQKPYKSNRVGYTSMGVTLEKRSTDTEGWFTSTALWPGQTYYVEVRAQGYSFGETIKIVGQPNQTFDFPTIRLVQINRSVAGQVIDSSGRPIENVRVFNSGDAPFPVSVQTDNDGRFQLNQLFGGPIFIFADKQGYRFNGTALTENADTVTIQLLKKEEPVSPASKPENRLSYADEKKMARRLLEQLWKLPDAKKKTGIKDILKYMARIDIKQALEWSNQVEKGKYNAIVQESAAKIIQESNPDEAVRLLGQAGGKTGFETAFQLAEKYADSNNKMALRYAELAARLAQSLKGREKISAYTRSGGLLLRLGKESIGKPMIMEATVASEKLDDQLRNTFLRIATAEQLALIDETRALELVKSITDRNNRERGISRIAVVIGTRDLEKGLSLLASLENPLVRDAAKVKLAERIATQKPATAIRLAEETQFKFRAQAFGRLSVKIASIDKPLAYSLIDRSLGLYLDEPKAFVSWSNWGGRSGFSAWAAMQARQIAYPDMESVVQRVLAARLSLKEINSPVRLVESRVAVARLLGLIDRAAAKQILEAIEPQSHTIGSGYSNTRQQDWYEAWGLVDPKHAAKLFEKALSASKDQTTFDLQKSGLLGLVDLLTIPPQDRAAHLLLFFQGL